MDAQLPARGALRRGGAPGPGAGRAGAGGGAADGREPTGQRRPPSRPPGDTRPIRLRDRGPATGRRARRIDQTPRPAAARPLRRQPGQLPPLLPRRDRLQPARRRLRGLRPLPDGRPPRGHQRLPRGAGDGGLVRAQLPGLAGGLPAEWPPRTLRHLRGLRDGLGLDGDPAHEVAGGDAAAGLAGPGRLAQRPPHLDLLAQRPQRLQPPGAGADRHDDLPAGRGRPHLLPARRQQPARRRRPLPAQPRLRQPDRRGQAAPAAVPDLRAGAGACRRRRLALGMGEQRRRRGHRRHPRLRRGHPDAGDPRRRLAAAPPHAGAESAGGQRDRPDDPVPARSSPARVAGGGLRRALRQRRRGRVRLPRLRPRPAPAPPRPPPPRPLPRPRLQRAGDDHHALRHGRDQPDEPLPPGAGGAAPRPPRARRRSRAGGSLRGDARPPPLLRARTPRGHARGPRLDLGRGLTVADEARRILTVNAGSSSLKLRVLDENDRVVASRDSDASGDETELLRELEAILDEAPSIDAAGHRVVHGGPEFSGPTIVNPSVEDALDGLADLAPLHNPPAIAAMRALDALRPGLPTVACFDTAFHATLPAAASTYAIPAAWAKRWPLRRYGFHGLSHSYASRRAAELLDRPLAELRIVTAHLGAGASLCAVAGGRSVDTTMGFTPLEGLVMATRSGSVDPGLLLWVQRHGGIAAEEMERALDRESGLVGLAGSADMREVLAAEERGDERAHLAVATYLHRLCAGIAAMAASLAGLDLLVFTGGVGENAAALRTRAADALDFLGVAIDDAANAAEGHERELTAPSATVRTFVIQAREDLEIARQVRAIVG